MPVSYYLVPFINILKKDNTTEMGNRAVGDRRSVMDDSISWLWWCFHGSMHVCVNILRTVQQRQQYCVIILKVKLDKKVLGILELVFIFYSLFSPHFLVPSILTDQNMWFQLKLGNPPLQTRKPTIRGYQYEGDQVARESCVREIMPPLVDENNRALSN